jgi:hypothetical protein
MVHPTLDTLSVEILCQICQYLDQTDKPSLKSLALVNKQLNAVAAIRLFRTITIEVRGESNLAKDIKLLPQGAIQHIRHLIVEGMMPEEDEKTKEIRSRYPYNRPSELQDAFYSPAKRRWEGFEKAGRGVYQTFDIEDTAWTPLATFIAHLPVLLDLTYNAPNQIAQCILESLHGHHPKCRLHINIFHLRSLKGFDPKPTCHEIELATSPCLYSISTTYGAPGPHNIPDYNKVALREIVADLAPNLKEVDIFWIRRPAEHRPAQAEVWQGFKLENRSQRQPLAPQRAALKRLVIEGLSNEYVLSWLELIDVSKLCVLEIGEALRSTILNYMATSCNFKSLNRLSIQLRNYVFSPLTHQQYDGFVIHFLSSLPPLKALKVIGQFGRATFDALLKHHGKQLIILHGELDGRERPVEIDFNDKEKEHIEELCPNLEDLVIKTTLYHEARSLGRYDSVRSVLTNRPTVRSS